MRDDDGRDVDRRPDADAPARPQRRGLPRVPARYSSLVYTVWTAGWITAFATGHADIGLPMMLITGGLAAVVERKPRRQRPPRPNQWQPGADGSLQPPWQQQRPMGSTPPVPAPPAPPPPVRAPAPPTAEDRLAGAVVRAETSGGRLDPHALQLVRELDRLLRPMLAQLRGGDADAAVRHDVEAIAAEHLPAALDAYLAMPSDFAHEHRTQGGITPADELRSQLTLLVAGCRQLGDALRQADVSRQQELSRFLEAKFRRGDLDL